MTAYWTALLDFIYPPKCPACKKQVDEQGAWCPMCLTQIVELREFNLRKHGLTNLDSCQVICEYTGTLKRLIHDMKFRQQEKYAIYLRWLLKQHSNANGFIPLQYVIPVPLHTERLRERGYNQAEAIFKNWARSANLSWMPELLLRIRPTIPQWELNLSERKQNMKDAFMISRPEIINKQHVILVDDIVTTGVTLDECAKVLKKAGAIRVEALVIASGAH
ncbi:ComF family protein [Pelosinus sp. sgz500959]|uniref:ComF family protein n=1 Tax=Pelosinus sp. sgz500959 TaxID=3242472 RepID=UPI00366B9440